jgi:two-component system, OmpR family, sensor kinase
MPTSPSHWTLRAKLLASVLALFTVVMLATSALTVLVTQQYLTTQLTKDLQGASARVQEFGRGGYDADGDGRLEPPRGGPVSSPGGGNTLYLVLLPDGSVATNAAGVEQNAVVNDAAADDTLDSAQVREVSEAATRSGPTRVQVGGDVGNYLISTRFFADGTRMVVGVSTAPVEELQSQVLAVVVGGTAIGLVLVGVGGTVMIRRSLAPLDRVAATARRVSALKLDSGQVALAERVPAADADGHTEVGQVGLAINTMLDNVESALHARQESETQVRQFVADASHELRTPLASIRGYAELTRRETDPVPPTVTHAIGRVESEALRMQELVEDLLLLARLDSGRPLDREPVDLSLLAVNAVSDAHAASPDHTWELDLPEDPVEVPGDQARLHQILANLLANARTHTPAGTLVVTRVRPEGSLVRVSVTDDGPGVPESLQPRIFERFTRGDDARVRANGSTGLGLSIVAAVGHAHGGRVEVSSKPGATTFSVLLPAT